MTQVWVVRRGEDGEGSDVTGVFVTREAAVANAVERVMAYEGDGWYQTLDDNLKAEDYWHDQWSSWVEVRPYEVQC